MSLKQACVAVASPAGANGRERGRRDAIRPQTGSRWWRRRWRRGGKRPRVGAAPSTITAILRRQGVRPPAADAPRRWPRCAHAAPNDRWQRDFMGQRPLAPGRGQPLTVLDDHARCALGLIAGPEEQQERVEAALPVCLQRSGLPRPILTDKGPPWGPSGAGGLTAWDAWWRRRGVDLWPGRADHPQPQGQVEPLHGTIAADGFAHRSLADLVAAQPCFDAWRARCNHERPPQALAVAAPSSRSASRPRPWPSPWPPIVSGPDAAGRQVQQHGVIDFRGRKHCISRGLGDLPVAVRPTLQDDVFAVWVCHRPVATRDRREPAQVSRISPNACH